MWHQQRAVHLGGRVQNASEGLARVQRGDATGAVGSSRDRAFPSAAFGVGSGVAARHAVLPEPPETGKGEVIGQSGAWTKLPSRPREAPWGGSDGVDVVQVCEESFDESLRQPISAMEAGSIGVMTSQSLWRMGKDDSSEMRYPVVARR